MPPPPTGPSTPGLVEFFRNDHRTCDGNWSRLEQTADRGESAAAREAWQVFEQGLRSHLNMEEKILFPAFEQATGMFDAGPTQVMRLEHEQMRGLLGQMQSAIERGDLQELLDQGDTLLMLIQQHNSKEEGMLYPMAEQALGTRWPDLHEQIETLRSQS